MATEVGSILGITGPAALQRSPESADAEAEKLRRASNYELLSKTLRPTGIGSVVFGLIAMAMGFAGMDLNPANAVLGAIGVFLVVEGIWILACSVAGRIDSRRHCSPHRGLWNISVTISGGGNNSALFVLGIWQIVMGCKSFGRYGHFSSLPISGPPSQS
jgi:uncharacterized protein YjeT (DUF2065 family)